jgi:hypothetical protein
MSVSFWNTLHLSDMGPGFDNLIPVSARALSGLFVKIAKQHAQVMI